MTVRDMTDTFIGDFCLWAFLDKDDEIFLRCETQDIPDWLLDFEVKAWNTTRKGNVYFETGLTVEDHTRAELAQDGFALE